MKRIVTVPLLTAGIFTLFVLSFLSTSGKVIYGQRRIKESTTWETVLAKQRRVMAENELRRNAIVARLDYRPKVIQEQSSISSVNFCSFGQGLVDESTIDPHRSLLVHDLATLHCGNFSLKRTLDQIATQVGPYTGLITAADIFRQFWDTQNRPPGTVPSGPHCTGTINDFPIDCPRNEGSEAHGSNAEIDARIDRYKVVALVNRLDLAHEGWRNCGEYRIVYGKYEDNGRNFIIFEAVLPNPKPGCRESCLPVAEFWHNLSTIPEGWRRAQALENFFYNGLEGFRPIVHVDHYGVTGVNYHSGSSGGGQIRTNQFLSANGRMATWMLKEFSTFLDCSQMPCKFAIVPTMVKNNPYGELWNADFNHPRAANFRADVWLQRDRLASPSLTGISYSVDVAYDAGQSEPAGRIDNYSDQLFRASNNSFRRLLATTSNLTAEQMVKRALTQSCAGCHSPISFGLDDTNPTRGIGQVTAPDGNTVSHWPSSLASFSPVHISEESSSQPGLDDPHVFGENKLGFEISDALRNFFLPERKNFLIAQLNAPRCLCRQRFLSLDVARRLTATKIESELWTQFQPRFEAANRRALNLREAGKSLDRYELLQQEVNSLSVEFDKALTAALARKGITLPVDPSLSVKPHFVKLKRSILHKEYGGEAILLMRAVNQLLRREPPRRTVTGSFRVH